MGISDWACYYGYLLYVPGTSKDNASAGSPSEHTFLKRFLHHPGISPSRIFGMTSQHSRHQRLATYRKARAWTSRVQPMETRSDLDHDSLGLHRHSLLSGVVNLTRRPEDAGRDSDRRQHLSGIHWLISLPRVTEYSRLAVGAGEVTDTTSRVTRRASLGWSLTAREPRGPTLSRALPHSPSHSLSPVIPAARLHRPPAGKQLQQLKSRLDYRSSGPGGAWIPHPGPIQP